MHLLTILTEKAPLPVYVGESVKKLPFLLKKHGFNGKILILTDKNVANLYLRKIQYLLIKEGFDIYTLVLEAGEKTKNINNIIEIWDYLISRGFERFDAILSLGGGVIGDISGFVAATYKRGISLIQVPTSLMAQIDASIGGKNAVNFNGFKNQIGTFYQPRLTIIDTDFLKTLPEKEFINAMGEVIKYGMIMPTEFFTYLERGVNPELTDAECLKYIIWRCTQYKVDIVNRDERDEGIRKNLNFGHTIGHALESYFNGKLSHGECVGLGMLIESKIAIKLKMFSKEDYNRLKSLLIKFKLPVSFYSSPEPIKILEIIHQDKKNKGGRINMILPLQIGHVREEIIDNTNIIKEALSELE